MTLLEAILLGTLQGATEFLPISSSGHLVLAERYLGIQEGGLTFDVALHLGTLLSILTYFRADILRMLVALAAWSRPGEGGRDEDERRLALWLALATVPAVLAGLVLGDLAETVFRSPTLVAVNLVLFGILLLVAERLGGQHRHDLDSLTLADALIVGLAQALAIVPGVSRSGITMTAGLFRGLGRSAAARFSFLLSAPVIAGAGLYNAVKVARAGFGEGQALLFLAGFVASAVSGYLFIAFLMRYVQTRSFAVFAYYRFALAALVLLTLSR